MRWLLVVALVGCGHSRGTPFAGGGPDGDPNSVDASGASSSDAATTTIWTPHPGTSWQWQLEDDIDTSFDVAMYDIDLFDTPQATIDALHAAGRIVICYVDVGSYEPGRPDRPSSQRGARQPLDGWPDEYWLDARSSVVRRLTNARLDVAVSSAATASSPTTSTPTRTTPASR